MNKKINKALKHKTPRSEIWDLGWRVYLLTRFQI